MRRRQEEGVRKVRSQGDKSENRERLIDQGARQMMKVLKVEEEGNERRGDMGKAEI